MLRARLRDTLLPRTLEQSIAIYMLVNFLSFFPRPFAAGIETLYETYRLPLTVQALQIAMGLFGIILYLKRRVGSLAAVVLFAPFPLYAVALIFYYANGERIGGLGWTGYILLTGFSYGWYILRSRREREESNPNGHP